MNTKLKIKKQEKRHKSDFEFAFLDGKDPDLIESLRVIDINSPDAKLNETSINDGRGGRVELNEDGEKITKK